MEQYIMFDKLPQKIEAAVSLFRYLERSALVMNPEGFYVAFSGGKDSVVIYALAKLAGVRFKAHYHLTTVDPPELVWFIREYYPDVEICYPAQSMWRLIVEKQIPPTPSARYCCEVLKEQGGEGSFTVTGVRKQESQNRQSRELLEIFANKKADKKVLYLNNDNDDTRRQLETCALKGKRIFNPIIDWTDEDVWRFILSYKLPYCGLYNEGFSRIGCIGCPLASVKIREKEFIRYPKYKRAYIMAFDRMVDARTAAGKTKGNWPDGESVFNWWMYGRNMAVKQVEGQIDIGQYDMAA